MKKNGLVYNKLMFSAVVILLYLLGKKIPIPWVLSEAADNGSGMLGVLKGMLGTASIGSSVLSLGLQPYIASSIFTQLYVTIFKKDKKDYSQTRVSRAAKVLALLIAIPQAIMSAMRMELRTDTGLPADAGFALTVIVLIAGTFIVIWLSERIQARGIGGQSTLILVNMLDNYRTSAWAIGRGFLDRSGGNPGHLAALLLLLLLLVVLTVLLVVIFENAEIRVPIHRGIMHNTLTEVDYVAIKLNPAGSMPVMYVMTVFSLPYYILGILNLFIPMQDTLRTYQNLLSMNTYSGLAVFIVLLWALTFLIAVVTVNPDDISDNLQKQGDYILDIPAGKTTRRLFRRDVLFTAFLSAFMVSLVVGLPIAVRIAVHGDSPVFMLPMNLFIIVSIFVRIYDEARVLHLVEDYEPFL